MRKGVIVFWTLVKVASAVLFIGWCALHLRRWDPYFGVVLPTWFWVLGVLLLVFGSLVVLSCGAVLSTRKFGEPGDRFFPKEFVTTGPFRYVRNPMSLGAVALMLGLGLYDRSMSLLLLSLILFVFIHLIVVYIEEPGLAKRFGDGYLQYKRSVNRWLPSFR